MKENKSQTASYLAPGVSEIKLMVRSRILSLSPERDIDDGTEGEEDGD